MRQENAVIFLNVMNISNTMLHNFCLMAFCGVNNSDGNYICNIFGYTHTHRRISDIVIFLGTFCPHNLRFTRTHIYTHTNTQKLLSVFAKLDRKWSTLKSCVYIHHNCFLHISHHMSSILFTDNFASSVNKHSIKFISGKNIGCDRNDNNWGTIVV